MTHQSTWKTLVMLLLFSAVAIAQQKTEQKTFTGTWTCLNCDLAGLDGSVRTQCEDLGHRHCLRLDNGKYLFFLDNDHAAALIKGGGRHETLMTVKGTYYPGAHTIDVQSYVIDGKTSSWCAEHKRMDLCNDPPSAKRAEREEGK
jgi:hypothetical protein